MPHTFLTDAEASDLSADEYERYRRLRGPAYRAPLLPRTAADRMNDADIRAIVHRVSATRADGSIPFTDLANFCTDLQLPPESLGVRHVAALPAAVLLALRRRERCWPGQDTNTRGGYTTRHDELPPIGPVPSSHLRLLKKSAPSTH